MRIHPVAKAVLVAVPAGLWLAYEHTSLGRAIALVAGGTLVAFAGIRLTRRGDAPAPARRTDRTSFGDRRVERRPRRRLARDVRCPAAHRATARPRRPARR